MIANRSVPTATVIPVLAYDDVARASDWLCRAVGFTERLRIADHRAQLVFGDGAVILTSRDSDGLGGVLLRVRDADEHHERARESGARILHPPTDYPYGERQYVVDPASWGGTLR